MDFPPPWDATAYNGFEMADADILAMVATQEVG
jgi:hypothetical protein